MVKQDFIRSIGGGGGSTGWEFTVGGESDLNPASTRASGYLQRGTGGSRWKLLRGETCGKRGSGYTYQIRSLWKAGRSIRRHLEDGG